MVNGWLEHDDQNEMNETNETNEMNEIKMTTLTLFDGEMTPIDSAYHFTDLLIILEFQILSSLAVVS